MADTPGTVIIKDGASPTQARPELVLFDASLSNFAFQRVLRANGAAVDITNPLPTRVPAVAPVASGGIEAAHVLNAAPCSVGAIQVNTGATAGWLMLFDASSIPADGVVAPKKWWQIAINTTLDRTFTPPLAMATGATLVFSATGPMTKTGSPTAVFSGETW